MTFQFNIVGGGGLAREVATWAFNSNIPIFEKPKFYVQKPFADGTTNPLSELDPESRCVIAVGSPLIKRKLEADAECEWVSMLHKTAIWREFNMRSEGLIMCPYSIITDNVVIGKHVTLNLHASIGHESEIGNYVTVHPGARVSGNCIIGEGCLIGSNAVIKEGTYIAPWTIIGAGAVVTRSIYEPGTYVGVPAKRIGE